MPLGPEDDPREAGTTSVLDAPPASDRAPVRRRRWGALGAAVVVLAAVVTAVVAVTRQDAARTPVVQTPDPSASAPAQWMSGASGEGVTDGSYAAWRGRPVEIAGSWSDTTHDMTQLYQLQPGAEFGSWDLPMDVAIGAIGEDESWQEAADGAYDDRWRQSLVALRDAWAGRPGTLYIRFAHEMNGDWYPWRVEAESADAFVESWRRFRALQQEVFPESQLVFCVNRESVDTGIDWRETFPGARYVDVMGVDYYNQFPAVSTAEEWTASIDDIDAYGAPKGLQRHLDFARSVGLPLAVPEWSGNADEGDLPAFVEGMYSFFRANAGDGPGEVLYEIQFNVARDEDRWLLFGEATRMPESAAAYQRLW